MKQKIILNTIIDEIYQIENYIQKWRDNEVVPAIERDLIQRKLQEIYDEIQHLNTVTTPENEKTGISEYRVPDVADAPPKEISVAGEVREIVFEKTTEIIEQPSVIQHIPIHSETVSEIIEAVAPVSKPAEELTESPKENIEPVKQIIEVTVSKTEIETDKIKSGSREILAEKLGQTHKLINETIKARAVMDVSSKLKNSPILSIQSAINLNDKFVFIRELFKNNNLLYNQTIERLIMPPDITKLCR
ncbi:MAG: hypothetical protein HC830_03015 [Bacteroidetes bacterium]|nr:hypothetical protein [Bacteroidota bacterium]